MLVIRQPRGREIAQKCARKIVVATFGLLVASAGAEAQERQALIVSGDQAPARIARAAVLTPSQGPPVVLYAAENLADQELDQFTVMAFVFKADGTLKARQTAPGRRTLTPKETKYSTLVVDGGPVEPTDIIVIGINQVQRAGSDTWWRAELQRAAEAAVPLKKK
jgi:hypothetical protein